MPTDILKAIERLESTAKLMCDVEDEGGVHFFGEARLVHAQAIRLVTAELRIRMAPKAKKPKAAAAPRARDPILDALAELDGQNIYEVAKGAWSNYAKIKAEIKSICPNLTVEELQRRADLYKKKWPDRQFTVNALAKWWGALGGSKQTPSVRLGDNLI